MSTIYIMWLRQIKRYLRSKSRIVGSLGQPLLFLLALGYGFGPTFQKAGQGNYIYFLVPGVIAMTVLFSSVFFGIEIIWDRQFGFLKETMVAPVSRFNIMLGRTLGGATVSSIQGLIVFCISLLVGFRPANWLMVLPMFLIMFLISLLFTSLGTAIASKMEDMHGFQLIMNFLIMPLFFLSGALFPLNNLPKTISVITRFNPLSYGVDALRGVLINGAHFGLGLDILVLSVLTLFFLGLGSFLFSKIQI
ncbi:MAG: ABC transporter permease [Candidatus Doudnabacteria bacterium]|nr:ABC transporter permease [Candidatus Doudnabacteria bacterium]